MKRTLKIGTRGSPLALIQAKMVACALKKTYPDLSLETVIISTSGDKVQDRALAELGGKGLFVKEIEEALFLKQIDLAVHSMKDVPSFLPSGLEIAAMLPREDARDVLLSKTGGGIAGLPKGAIVGTSSPRRGAALLARRPDLKIILFRGNVGTRIEKFENGTVDATLLAAAGLNRLDIKNPFATSVSPDEILPAAGQAAVGIEIREDDTQTKEFLAALHDSKTGRAVAAERAFLRVLDGDCRSPLAAYAQFSGELLKLRCFIARPDGSEFWEAAIEQEAKDKTAALELGQELGMKMKAIVPMDYLESRKRA